MLSKKAINEIALQVKEARERNAGRNELKNVLMNMGVKFVVFDSEGIACASDKKPSVEELLVKILCEVRAQTELLKAIKNESTAEVYLDDLLKGQDSTNKQLGELVQAAERISNNTTATE
jgi:hypothetical protein